MARIFEGNLFARDLKIGIVVSRFNELITKAMLDGALNELRQAGVAESNLHVVWVPGAYEIPGACEMLLKNNVYDALITIGCIIRGETSHYQHMAQSVSDALQKIAVQHTVPVGFGVLTVENLNQALDRTGGKHGNKGRDAARSAVEMANLFHSLQKDEAVEAFNRLINTEFES